MNYFVTMNSLSYYSNSQSYLNYFVNCCYLSFGKNSNYSERNYYSNFDCSMSYSVRRSL